MEVGVAMCFIVTEWQKHQQQLADQLREKVRGRLVCAMVNASVHVDAVHNRCGQQT